MSEDVSDHGGAPTRPPSSVREAWIEMPDPEVWLRGPIPGVSPLLQPVAHSLLQSREEMTRILRELSAADIWSRPGGAASIGFHARHAAGSLDRLLTYARGEELNTTQLALLGTEATPDHGRGIGSKLVEALDSMIDEALRQLRATDDTTLLAARGVGRARLPSTVLGLLVHAAEHTQRHVGQLVTTAGIVRDSAAARPPPPSNEAHHRDRMSVLDRSERPEER